MYIYIYYAYIYYYVYVCIYIYIMYIYIYYMYIYTYILCIYIYIYYVYIYYVYNLYILSIYIYHTWLANGLQWTSVSLHSSCSYPSNGSPPIPAWEAPADDPFSCLAYQCIGLPSSFGRGSVGAMFNL